MGHTQISSMLILVLSENDLQKTRVIGAKPTPPRLLTAPFLELKLLLLFYHKLDRNLSTDFKFHQKISFRLRFITMQSLKLPPITP